MNANVTLHWIIFSSFFLYAALSTPLPQGEPAEGHVRGVTATYERGIGVILRGVHPEFVVATREAQGKLD